MTPRCTADTPGGPEPEQEVKSGEVRRPCAGRGTADPVKALMHRHRELYDRAVDPLEIAAGLEAQGMTDRTAARFRHRDVFSLAEELYARAPRTEATVSAPRASTRPEREPAAPGLRASPLTLLPGAVCALALGALAVVEADRARLGITVAGAVGVAFALRAALGSGPLHAPGRIITSTRLFVCWLLAYALFGGPLLEELLAGGPDGLPAVDPADASALAAGLVLAFAPAAWCADLFRVLAGRKLASCRGLGEFTARTRPLLLAGVLLFTSALLALLHLARLQYDASPEVLVHGTALGVLLYLARLLTVHGFPDPAAGCLAAACAVQAAVLAAVPAGRLPGLAFLARPVEAAVATWGPGALPAAACAGATLALLCHAVVALSRASAHTS
jgi:hypothetical protein